jgi:hypothetical protein
MPWLPRSPSYPTSSDGPSPGIKARKWPSTPASPSPAVCRCSSATRAAHGSAAPTRTPTACCANTSHAAPASPNDHRPSSTRSPPNSTDALGLERGHRTLTILRKGGKIVTIPLAPRTARAIDLAVGERCDGPIFVAANEARIDRHAAGRIVRRIARPAGIAKRVGPHTLRHAFITAALDAGVPLRDVQEAASHADPRTTMRYDRARVSLDRQATYIVATFLAGASR